MLTLKTNCMNPPFNKKLVSLINDFNLVSVDDLVSFKSRILYIKNGEPYHYLSEVNIVTIPLKNIDTIYLLSNNIVADGFEDSFKVADQSIEYYDNSYLLIKRLHNTNIYIFPISSKQDVADIEAHIKTVLPAVSL